MIFILYRYHNSRVIIISHHNLIYLIILCILVLPLNLHLISKLSALLLFRVKLIFIRNLRWSQWIFLIFKEIQIKIINLGINSNTDDLWISFYFLISFTVRIASTILSLMTILPITLNTESFWFLATMISFQPFFHLQCQEISILYILIIILVLNRIWFYCLWSFVLICSLFTVETCWSLIFLFIWVFPFLYLI